MANDIPPDQLERITPILNGLRQDLARLLERLPEAPSSAIRFEVIEDEGE
jgi:hypothetical protein